MAANFCASFARKCCNFFFNPIEKLEQKEAEIAQILREGPESFEFLRVIQVLPRCILTNGVIVVTVF